MSELTPLVGREQPVYREARAIALLMAPLIATFFLQYVVSATTIWSTGRLGARELAAASLAVCSFNITGLGVFQGMATCLDLFCSQAFGANKPYLVGVYLQRCVLMMLALIVFPLGPIWWWSGSILQLLVADHELAAMCQTYLRIQLVGAPGLVLFEAGKRFLQAQRIFNAGTYVLAVAVPLSVGLNYALVLHSELGFAGAPLATAVVYWVMALLLFLYVFFVDGRRCWAGFDAKAATTGWRQMLQLAVPGVVMVEAEYLAFEVLTIFAASFGTTALAAQSICSNVGLLIFQMPFAVSVAVSVRIGHYVGDRSTGNAALVTKVAFFYAAGMSCFNFLVVFLGKTYWARLFSSDDDVVDLALRLLVLVALNQIADGFNVLEAGILRGQGRQQVGLLLSLVSYYVIALPLGYVCAFKGTFGIYGLWLGLVTGVAALAASQFVFIYKSNWLDIVRRSESRQH